MLRPGFTFALLLSLLEAFPVGAAVVSFDYDRSVPLEFTTEDTQSVEGGVRLDDVVFRSGDRTIRAALVHPQTDGNAMPGVLFVHGLGEQATSDRSEFIGDAEWLARRGVVSLVPDEPWSSPRWLDVERNPANAERDSVAEVISLRRSVDALLAIPGVDERRIAYVGHGISAQYGALLAESDSRVPYYVFMTPSVAVAPQMGTFDIAAALGAASLRATLVQIGARDKIVKPDDAKAFVAALSPRGRTVTTYDDGHALTEDAATDDRRNWLIGRFGL
jgi:dienelactone hydrolase